MGSLDPLMQWLMDLASNTERVECTYPHISEYGLLHLAARRPAMRLHTAIAFLAPHAINGEHKRVESFSYRGARLQILLLFQLLLACQDHFRVLQMVQLVV